VLEEDTDRIGADGAVQKVAEDLFFFLHEIVFGPVRCMGSVSVVIPSLEGPSD
jgi:hypothetical protein